MSKKQRKPMSKFWIGIIVYVVVFAFVVLIADELLWTKLEYYEVTENVREKEQREKFEKAKAQRIAALTVTPTPTPVPIYLETVKIVKPLDAVLYVNGEKYEEPGTEWTAEEDKVTFADLTSVTNQYPEYKGVLDGLLPSRESTVVTIEKGSVITFRDGNGNEVTPSESTAQMEIEEQLRTIRELTCPYTNNTADSSELSKYGFEFLTKFCLFISHDKSPTEMKPYFPDNSQYYNVIASLDNTWFNEHKKPPEYTEQTVRTYHGYGDSLVYMELTMRQSFVASYTGQQFETIVEHPIWLVKMNGKWKVASIIFNAKELQKPID